MIDKIDIPIYSTSVVLLIEITEKELKDFYKDNKNLMTYEEYKSIKEDMKAENIKGATMTCDSGNYLIYLKNGKSDNFVSHEIFHVCNRILLNKGVHIDEDAEPWAYLIGWFTDEYYRRYWKQAEEKQKKK